MARLVNQLQPTTESNYVSLDAPIGSAGDLGSIITIGSEQMLVRDGLGTTGLDVERAVNGTTIAAHQVGASVSLTRAAHPVYAVTREFTETEMNSLDTPIELVPAPGANHLIVPHAYAYKFTATAELGASGYPYFAYTDYNDNNWYVPVGQFVGTGDLGTATGMHTGAGAFIWSSAPSGNDVMNCSLVMQSDSAGSGTATMTVTVFYTIADLG